MLATDTQEIVDYLREEIVDFYRLSPGQVTDHFADTRDTLCYATNDNQSATYGLLQMKADFAIVAGGYNSSNTAHLVDLCEEKLPTYFIKSAEKLVSMSEIWHFNNRRKEEVQTWDYIPSNRPVKILLTCGASCPDAVMEEILRKIVQFFPTAKDPDSVIDEWIASQD
jgi:4-hydroxy-3-methylbut-2-enyl diphosphate reductase